MRFDLIFLFNQDKPSTTMEAFGGKGFEEYEADYQSLLENLKKKSAVKTEDDGNQCELNDLLKNLLTSVQDFTHDLGQKVNLVEQLTRDISRVSDNKVFIPIEEDKMEKMAAAIHEAREIIENGKSNS